MLDPAPLFTITLQTGSAPADAATLSPQQLPMWLARRHGSLAVGTDIVCTLRAAAGDGAIEAAPRPLDGVLVHDVFEGAGFHDIARSTRREVVTVRATRARTLADRVGPDLRLLVCGLNPSLYAADAGVAFARPGNRFWPALLGAGLVERDRDPDRALADHGIGFTDLVKRATRTAQEVDPAEFHEGAQRVERLVHWLQPGAVCFFGVTGYRAGVDRRASAGVLPGGFGGRPAMLLGNPSGLNAHCRLDELTEALRSALDLAADAAYGPVRPYRPV